MSGYRQIHTQIWTDDWFAELATDEKMFFIYLFSNDAASMTGLYKLSLRVMEFESGIKRERILEMFAKFAQDGKAYYENGVVLVTNMQRYHNNASPLVKVRIAKDIELIPDCHLKRLYLYGMDTQEIGNREIDKLDESKLKQDQSNTPTATAYIPDEQDNIQVLATLTGMLTIPATQREPANNALYVISAKFNTQQDVIEYLRPFYTAWKDERHYSKSNLAWLTDWAVTGEIPPPKKNGNIPQVPESRPVSEMYPHE